MALVDWLVRPDQLADCIVFVGPGMSGQEAAGGQKGELGKEYAQRLPGWSGRRQVPEPQVSWEIRGKAASWQRWAGSFKRSAARCHRRV